MFAQAILDIILIVFVLWIFYSICVGLFFPESSVSTLEAKIKELKEQREKLKQLEKEEETLKDLVQISKQVFYYDAQIKKYEEQLKRKGS